MKIEKRFLLILGGVIFGLWLVVQVGASLAPKSNNAAISPTATQMAIKTLAPTTTNVPPTATSKPAEIKSTPTSTMEAASRCVPASAQQLDAIRSGIKDKDSSNDVKSAWAVKSNDFERVWMVAAKIYGPAMENGMGPGVWAISGDLDAPGMMYSVDGFAKNFSTWGDGSKTKANLTIANDGVAEAMECARGE